MNISSQLLINPEHELNRIVTQIRNIVTKQLHRRGLVVAISGGVDSAVCSELAVRALGPERVYGLLLPEQDSSLESVSLGRMVVDKLGIDYEEFNIAPALAALGCYRWRDSAIRNIFPDYSFEWKNKIVIAGGQTGQFNYFKLVVQSPDGQILEAKLDHKNYLQIVAATNFKQRVRKMVEYFHADRLHYSVVGTPNRLEYDQGFFVKNGDGAADLKPIAHLYKTQVYSLARYLGLPEEICSAQPTTDTYSLSSGQDEFYFALPYEKMDIALMAYNSDEPASELASELGIDVDLAEFIYRDIAAKRKTTAFLHWPAILMEPVCGPTTCPPIS